MIINFKNDYGSNIIINMDNVIYTRINGDSDGGYFIEFIDKSHLRVSYGEYDRILDEVGKSK